ncbi:MAG TPA: DUF4351 domain-containing protein [Thermoanaerobaculia bacterium]|nr:DUF4351 domain-containing protein [Thermoanaerobaculia bacterium]
MTSHDQLWKDLFRTFFPDLLFLVDPDLAARLVGSLGPGGFTFLDKEVFHDLPVGERHEVDLLAETPDGATGGSFRIHVEIERRFGGEIGRRMARYAYHLYLRDPGPVVSVVVFLRGGPSGIRWIDHVERAFDREILRFNYVSIGLSKLPARTLLDRAEPLAWALAALAWPGRMGRARLKLELLRKIATAQLNEVERFLLANCVQTYLQLAGRDAEEYAALRLAQENPEVEAMEMTWADRMVAEYRQKVLAEGLEQGIEKGVEQGVRRTLLRLLGRRFGEVPPAVRARVEAIDSLDELGGLTDRILEVKSIEELGLGH